MNKALPFDEVSQKLSVDNDLSMDGKGWRSGDDGGNSGAGAALAWR